MTQTHDNDLRQVIMGVLEAEGHRDGLTAQTRLGEEGLALTSLELVRLLVSLEERLGVEFDDAVIMGAHFDTIDDIVTLIAQSA